MAKKKAEPEVAVQQKQCFVICPIGSDGSPERRSADGLVITYQEILGEDWEVVAAHQMNHPG